MIHLLSKPILSKLIFFFVVIILGLLVALYAPNIPLKFILGVFVFIGIFILIFLKIEWGLYLLIFSMAQSFEIPLLKTGSETISIFTDDIILFIIILAWFSRQLVEKRGKWEKTPLNKPLLILIFIAFLSLIYSGFRISPENFLGNFFHLFKWIEYMLVFFMVINLVKSKKQVHSLIKVLILASVFVALYGIYEKFTGNLLYKDWVPVGGDKRIMRYTSTFETGHELGAFLSIPIVLLISFFLEIKSKKQKIFILLLIGICLYAFFNAYSRGSYSGLYAALFALALIRKDKKFLFFLLAFIPLAFFVFPKEVVERIKFTFQQGFDRATRDRLELWLKSLNEFVSHPVLGIGFWNVYSPLYLKIGPHNSYLQTLLELGLFGFATFIWLLYNLFKATKNIFQKTKDTLTSALSSASFAIFVGFLIFSITAEVFYWSRIIGYFWLLAGLVFVLKRRETQNVKE